MLPTETGGGTTDVECSDFYSMGLVDTCRQSVLCLMQAPSVGSGAAADREQHVNSADDSTESGSSCEDDDTEGERSRMGQAYVGSIASTYWRPERTNRGALSAIDERYRSYLLQCVPLFAIGLSSETQCPAISHENGRARA